MPNPFDTLKASLFKTVTNHMGYKADWLSSTDMLVRSASLGVTFKYPTLKEKQFLEWDEFVYSPPNRIVEYMEPDFPGLYDSVNNTNGTSMEFIKVYEHDEVNGEEYVINSVRRMFDGSVIYAWVAPPEPEEE